MAKKQSMKEIAEAAGVSIATVSRVINRKPDVKEDTRARVIEELDRSAYRVRSGASPTALKLIGFVNDFRKYPGSQDYVARLLQGAQTRTSNHAYHLVMIDSDAVQKEIRWPGRYEVFQQLSGLIWSMPVFDDKLQEFLEARGIPYVVINNLRHGVQAPLVESDNFTAARQAVEYLIGLGHRKIGFMGGAFEIANMEDRYKGFRLHMKEFGLEVDPDWVIDDLAQVGRQSAIEGCYRLIGRKNLPTALISVSQSVTEGIYQVFQSRGIRVPDDISLVSFDDTPVSEVLTPPVTTFRQHLDRMAEDAVDLLMDLIHSPETIKERPHLVEPMTLIVRDSARELAARDE